MRLQPGVTLAHYEVLGALGAGGMGEVYRARDSKLRREVALKVLPEAFADHPERLARLEREARSLAALNHPHIGAIHGFETAADVHFLVLELVPGPTLAERLARGRLPLVQALDLARQTAEALEEAHGRGILHRDLKPANIKLTPEGRVKVLDFGVAKAVAEDGSSSGNAPTLTVAETGTGVVLGTPAYISPEQARGEEVDKRTDIWAFGCVLYEVLTGKRAFRGGSTSETLAAVLTAEPDWSALPEEVPATVLTLVRRCLRKDRQRRLHDIADGRLELEEALTELSAPSSAVSRGLPALRRRIGLSTLVVVSAALVLAAVGTLVLFRVRAQPAVAPAILPLRLNIDLPEAAPLTGDPYRPHFALSPDGKLLVYVAQLKATTQLYLRPLDRLEAQPIPGTEGARIPFFSPDGEWVGFAADGKLKKVSLRGGPPITLCDAPDPRGASWGEDGTIVFTPTDVSGLSRVSAAGGKPRVLTRPDSKVSHYWPRHLPGGRAVLFTALAGNQAESHIMVLSLETGRQREVLEGGTGAQYVPSGHVLYGLEGSLLAAPFDLGRLEVTGHAVTVLNGVAMSVPSTGAVAADSSPVGPLVYESAPTWPVEATLVWVDRQGRGTGLLTEARRPYGSQALSPDGKSLAVSLLTVRTMDVWTLDLARGTWTRLTFDGHSAGSVWSPDGSSLAFCSLRNGLWQTFVMPAGGGPTRRLTDSGAPGTCPSDWSPDGSAITLSVFSNASGWDILLLPLTGAREPRPLVVTRFQESLATFSPNGRWIAYASNESGRSEIYVRPAGGSGEKWVISQDGGLDSQWSPTGKELFYRSGDKLMTVAVESGERFVAGAPRELFSRRWPRWRNIEVASMYDVSPDGQRFLVLQPSEKWDEPSRIVFISNWLDELKRLVPAGKG